MVVVAGDPSSPAVILRRRMELVADARRFAYHAAAAASPAAAEAAIVNAHKQAQAAARQEITAALKDLRQKGWMPMAAALPDPREPPGPLEAVLAVHAKLHAAEGWFYRSAVAQACAAAGLAPILIDERRLWRDGATALGIGEDAVRTRVKRLGEGLGPPWAEDQRLCALMAWLALRRV